MCDSTAVSWSEYESHKREIEFSVRSKIAEELLALQKISERNGDPECYVQGIKRATDAVVSRIAATVDSEHPKLF